MNIDKMKRLDSPERLAEYQIDKLFELMNIKAHEIILDVGSGTGALTIPLAKELDTGCVKAIDIDNKLLEIIDNKIEASNIDNIETILFDGTLPITIGMVDKVFACVVFHEIEDKREFLNLYNSCLKAGGAIYIVEFTSSKRRINDNSNVKREYITSEATEKLLSSCGFADISTTVINELIYMTIGYKA